MPRNRRYHDTGLDTVGPWRGGDGPGECRGGCQPVRESLRLFRALGDRRRTCWALHRLADVARDHGDYERAYTLYAEVRALAEQAGDRQSVADLLHAWGEAALLQGDLAAALAHEQASLAIWRELGTKWGIGLALHNLGYVAQQQGDVEGMAACFAESLHCFQESGSHGGLKIALAGLAGVATMQGQALAAQSSAEHAGKQALRAARLFGAAEAIRQRVGHAQLVLAEQNVAVARVLVDEAAWAAAWAEGQAMTLEQAVAYALATGTQPDRDDSALHTVPLSTPSGAPPAGADGAPVALTTRELEVLRLVAQGYTDQAVATRLGLRPRTVSSYLTAIYSKLGVTSRSAATRYALEHHLL